MTRAHSYIAEMDSRGRPYYVIDGDRVSKERYIDSFARSERTRVHQTRSEESGRFGSFRPAFYEQRESLREAESLSKIPREYRRERVTERGRQSYRYTIAEFTERIRGTRISQTVVRIYTSTGPGEVRQLLGSQYDHGGNYVLSVEKIDTEKSELPPKE